ncbi:MAG: signal peptidase I [Inquilinus sp.]|nr:signal peptidase I [Inquilinus sp.]
MTDKKASSGLGETVRTIVYALLIALGVRTLAYQPFNIPSGSMIPTLLEGDFLFVSKFSYGYSKYSVAFGLPLFDGRILNSVPERGDVIVFKLPSDPSQTYIKRLVGLPGDRIRVSGGILHINDTPVLREPKGAQQEETGPTRTFAAVRYAETLPNGLVHDILEFTDTGQGDNTREFVVPEKSYFMMGDNRDNSSDSRFSVGFVNEEFLIGRAEVIWFSLGDDTRFWEVWKWPWAIRYDRMFTGID